MLYLGIKQSQWFIMMYEDYIKMKIYFFVFQYIWYIRIYIENILKIEGNIHKEKIYFKPIFIMFLDSSHIA